MTSIAGSPSELTNSIRQVTLIGAGTIGASWAAYLLARGLEVHAFDPREDAETSLHREVTRLAPLLRELGHPFPVEVERLHMTNDLATALDGADFVQESSPEVREIKVDLFARIDRLLPRKIIIASSSSGFTASQLAGGMDHPERLVIGHPFNPPHLMPLVEMVAGELTSPETMEGALSFYRAIGKHPITLHKERRGHVANRLQAALLQEAISLVAEGVVSVDDLDAAVAYGPGLRWALMGPFLTFHLGGGEGGLAHFLDHLATPFNEMIDDLGEAHLNETNRDQLLEGIVDELHGRSIEELATLRDERLATILRLAPPI